jgi:hypothetical protein
MKWRSYPLVQYVSELSPATKLSLLLLYDRICGDGGGDRRRARGERTRRELIEMASVGPFL